MEPETKTAEAWADAKGLTRIQKMPGEAPKKVPDWRFAAAKAFAGWPDGQELSEAEFDAAVTAALGAPLRSR
jgi:hypothetical protein